MKNTPTEQQAHEQPNTGFLFIDKPADWTSHDVVNRIRALTDVRKVGHAGTLDPFATGLLIVAVQRIATREIKHLVGLDKTYDATFVLGARSETGDPEGEITPGTFDELPNRETIAARIQTFVGDIKQRPSAYSAVKVGGKKLYEFAREGINIDPGTRDVTIHAFSITGDIQHVDDVLHVPVRVHCSSGTYVRALARDLGAALGVGGYVATLRRLSIGPVSIREAAVLDTLTKENISKHFHTIDSVLKRVAKK